MPEATIDKNGQLRLGKRKVGPSWNPEMASPSSDPVGSEERHQLKLGAGISPTQNLRHYFRAFAFIESVHLNYPS
jgi:hypothetical protein